VEINVKKINAFTREIEVNVAWEECRNDFQLTAKKFGKKVRIPGFRPGKIPTKVLMNKFLPNIEAEFIEEGVNKYYRQALEEEKLVTVNKAEVKDVHFHFEEHFTFKAVFELNLKWYCQK